LPITAAPLLYSKQGLGVDGAKRVTTISVLHVSKSFEQIAGITSHSVLAVDDVTLTIASGSVLAILGPSGCGKSTLLRLIAGLLVPDHGQVLYDNVNLRDVPLMDRGIGMVFQDGALMPHWEARRTVGFFMWLRHREAEVPERVARISQITGIGLEKLLDRRPSQLSGGERQRVAVARALVRDPKVFLFDEPFSNLDVKLRGQARVELKRLLNEFPVTSVYVTHDQFEASALAQRIAVMRAGKVELVGTYHHLYENPVNLFVATFIGTPTINLFAGHVQDHRWQGVNFGGYPIRHDIDEGTSVTLGVRAEYIDLAEDGAEAQVTQVTPLYSERTQLIEVKAGGETWTMQLALDSPVSAGDRIRCRAKPEGLLYFDPKTGRRIG
jgi:ABC-type sugar transport system ATPase subunit